MSIEVLDKENEMKTYLLITDTNNLSYISSIIASRKEVKIKSSQFSLAIRTRSFQKIMHFSSQISEEMIQLLLDGRIIKRLSTKNFQIPHSSQEEEEDSFRAEMAESTQTPKKYILDSEDINQEEHIKLKEESDSVANENENIKGERLSTYLHVDSYNDSNSIDLSILKQIPHQNMITRNFENFMIFWELLYCTLIILGVNMLIHLTALVVITGTSNTFYVFYCGVIAMMMFYVSFYALVKIIKDEQREISKEFCNEILLFCVLSSFLVWHIVDSLEEPIKKYLNTQSNFTFLFVLCISVEAVVIITNFIMEEVYREYDFAYKKYGRNKRIVQ